MVRVRAGLALVEVVVAVAVLGLVLAVLMPIASRARNADGLSDSIQNIATITRAAQAFHADHAGAAPMRAAGYSNGQVTYGWDGWNFGGKNCNAYWVTSTNGGFDEPAYTRMLNAYVYWARLPVPQGYVNTGSGSTWNFQHGHPTDIDRASVQIPLFRSPGDTRSYERNWPNPTLTISGYNDFGTSYTLNMKWWDDPTMGALGFTARYAEGAHRVGLAFGGANPGYIWVHDQVGDVVPYFATGSVPGEFGKTNYSVVGWVDGRVGYRRMVTNSAVGPGYTLFP